MDCRLQFVITMFLSSKDHRYFLFWIWFAFCRFWSFLIPCSPKTPKPPKSDKIYDSCRTYPFFWKVNFDNWCFNICFFNSFWSDNAGPAIVLWFLDNFLFPNYFRPLLTFLGDRFRSIWSINVVFNGACKSSCMDVCVPFFCLWLLNWTICV